MQKRSKRGRKADCPNFEASVVPNIPSNVAGKMDLNRIAPAFCGIQNSAESKYANATAGELRLSDKEVNEIEDSYSESAA